MIGRCILFTFVAVSTMTACASSSAVDPALPVDPVLPAEPVEGAIITVPLMPRTEFGASVAFHDHEVVDGRLTVYALARHRFAEGDPRYPRDVVWRPSSLGSSRCFGPGTFEFTSVEGGGGGFVVRARGDELVMHAGMIEATFLVRGHFVASEPSEGVSSCGGLEGVFPEADVVLELTLTSEVPVSAEIGGCEGAFETGDWVRVSANPRNADGSGLFVNVMWGRGVDLHLSADAGSLLFEPSVQPQSSASSTEVRLPNTPAEVQMTTSLGGSRTLTVVDESDIEFDVVPVLNGVGLVDGEIDGANPPSSWPRVWLNFEDTRAGATPLCQLSREVESISPTVCRPSELQGFDLVGNGLCELEWSAAGRTGVTSFEVRNVEMFGE